ncbi:hypothetical protein Hanom_Chr11g01041061 [Helianthus anomalus]
MTTSKHRKDTNASKDGSFRSLFMHADRADMFLMAVGLIGADGLGTPAMLFFTSTIMNTVGAASYVSADVYTHKINKVIYY